MRVAAIRTSPSATRSTRFRTTARRCGIDPKDHHNFYNRATAYRAIEDHGHATVDLTAALALDPNDADALSRRGNSYHVRHDYDRTVVDFSAVELPGTVEAWLTMLRETTTSPSWTTRRQRLGRIAGLPMVRRRVITKPSPITQGQSCATRRTPKRSKIVAMRVTR
jgi:hypothetical protein